jgi:nicotinamide riboside transporter PnuC
MTVHHKTPHQSFRRMWGWPIALGVLTAIGLISALFSDGGFGDMLAWVALGIPVVVCGWYGWRRQAR